MYIMKLKLVHAGKICMILWALFGITFGGEGSVAFHKIPENHSENSNRAPLTKKKNPKKTSTRREMKKFFSREGHFLTVEFFFNNINIIFHESWILKRYQSVSLYEIILFFFGIFFFFSSVWLIDVWMK
jgi:hypothetical protein